MYTMALHERDTVRDQFEDCVFADRDLTRPVAKYRFSQEGTLPRDAFQLVSDELMLGAPERSAPRRRGRRAGASSSSSSETSWNASRGKVPSCENRYLATGLVRSRSANTQPSN